MLAPEQSRAARAWLEWSQEDLAKRARVSPSTVRDFEKGRRVPFTNNLEALRLTLEMAGVTLLFRGEVPVGVQVTKPAERG
jgi:ribosome-binding protein aMBF1 (putative translation factor)